MRGLRFDLARITIEAQTPLTVGTGLGSDLDDALCVCDANGLPAIPGSSIAGALRHALAGPDGAHRSAACRSLFGYQDRDDGSASRAEVSWAQVHGPDDCPLPFRGAKIEGEFFALLSLGVIRDHVRLNERGVADDHGKFDETLVPRGARFTFELVVVDPEEGDLDGLLRLLMRPGFRLGGRTRRGFGRVAIVRCETRRFDLCEPVDRSDWARLPHALELPVPPGILRATSPSPRTASTATGGQADDAIRATIRLQPEDFWIFGRGEPSRPGHLIREKSVDQIPVTEPFLVWNRGRGSVAARENLVAASSIKGALRHRVAFHVRRLAGTWADPNARPGESSEPEEVEWLFGHARPPKTENDAAAAAGHVFVDDLYVSQAKDGLLQHVSLDRFSQGPMSGMLFSEAPLFGGGPLELTVDVASGSLARRPLDQDATARAREALSCALADLCEGRLALGGGSNRGHGYFRGTLAWTDAGTWIGGKA